MPTPRSRPTISPPNSGLAIGSESCERFLLRIRPALVRIARSYQIPPDDVDDLIQETFLLYFAKADEIRDPYPWFGGTIANRCICYWRSQRQTWRKLDAFSLLHSSHLLLPESDFGRVETRADLESLIRHLPRLHRRVLRLRYLLGYSADAIADMLGYHVASVRRIVRTALEHLALLWHQHVGAPPPPAFLPASSRPNHRQPPPVLASAGPSSSLSCAPRG